MCCWGKKWMNTGRKDAGLACFRLCRDASSLFVCAQQFQRLMETNFVPFQHKSDFLVSTIHCFCSDTAFQRIHAHTQSGILLSIILPYSAHLCSCHCKCAHRVMWGYVPENETTFSIEKQQATRHKEPSSLGREETLLEAQGRWWRGWLRNLRDFLACICLSPRWAR